MSDKKVINMGDRRRKQGKGRLLKHKGYPQLKRRPVRKAAAPIAPTGPIQLDDFQVEAIEAVLAGRNVLVAAPTGTGKTMIAEKLAEKVMGEGMGLIYTSPLKALSNQKFSDFKEMFGDKRVGLVTGDITINGDAPLTVMTTEIFRNKCFEDLEDLHNIAYVVFDEIHYLDDPHRGTAWEESILFAPPHINILGLSATVPNVKEVATWIAEVRNTDVLVVEERERAVPLEINWVSPDNYILNESQAKRRVKKLIEKRKEEIQQLRTRGRKKYYR
ncbi:DEAD/DEAH box helicase [Desulfofalx alkaliphila]|uniref:DEAD/DEAH box helicase n=1 Tax=Desulfofalx alkaliphila TaxID=105483 RepID=UPI001EE48B7B|nr:DEAD/DEAH box helicase [Desulfofalx alkaliphila]